MRGLFDKVEVGALGVLLVWFVFHCCYYFFYFIIFTHFSFNPGGSSFWLLGLVLLSPNQHVNHQNQNKL